MILFHFWKLEIMAKRIGANAQNRINKRNAQISDFFNSQPVVYTATAIMSVFGAIGVYSLMCLAILADKAVM